MLTYILWDKIFDNWDPPLPYSRLSNRWMNDLVRSLFG